MKLTTTLLIIVSIFAYSISANIEHVTYEVVSTDEELQGKAVPTDVVPPKLQTNEYLVAADSPVESDDEPDRQKRSADPRKCRRRGGRGRGRGK